MVNCDYMSNAKRLLRALFMLGRVKRKRNRETCEAIYAWDVLTAKLHIYTPTKCTRTLCISPACCGPSDVSEAPELSSPFARRSFQGNMCAGILPQLRQGLAGSTVGTGRVWESRGSVPLSFPRRHSASFSLAPVHRAASLPCPSHPYCTSSSPLFSPYILSFPQTPFPSLFSPLQQLTLLKPSPPRIHFPLFPLSSL